MTRWLALFAFLLLPSLAHAQATVVTSCGSTTLSAGTSHFVTVDMNGQSCQSGAGSGTGGGCSQATAYLARATGEVTHAADLTTLICGLVTDGVWAKLDALYVLAQQTQADAKLNLIGTSYTLDNSIGAVPFTAYKGFVGNSFGINTTFNPTTAPSPHLTPSSGTAGLWVYGGAANDAGVQLGTGQSFGDLSMTVNTGGNLFYGYIFPSGSGNVVTSPGLIGYFAVDRRGSGANLTDYYWNNSQINSSQGPASQAPNSTVVSLLSGSNATLSAAHIGASLGSAGNLALYNRLRTYMTSVGVP